MGSFSRSAFAENPTYTLNPLDSLCVTISDRCRFYLVCIEHVFTSISVNMLCCINIYSLDPRTDITFHEVQGDGTLKDLCQAQDNNQGGNNLVSSFMNLISDLLGNDVISAFNSEYKFDSQELQNDFKIRMKAMKPDCVDNITFRVPMSLIEIICKFNPNKEKVLTLDARFKEQATVIGNKLRINAELLKTVFDKSYERTFRDVHQLLRHPSMRGITSILLVGEFAVYPMLHKVVKQIFPDKRVIVPPNPDFAVLKGAVIYGHFFN